MWIGTQEGLNLFDGRTFQVFSKQSQPKKRLGGSFISDIVEDKKRNLVWVLTSYGDICGIDLRTRVIKKRLTHDSDKKPLSGKWMRSIALQGDTLWLAGLGAISGYNIESGSFISVDILQKASITKGDCNVSRLVVDKQNRLWLFCDGYGILTLDKQLGIYKRYRTELLNKVSEKRKLRFWDVSFHDSLLYVGTSWGVRVFKPAEKSITYLKKATNNLIDTAEILSLTFSTSQKVFFSTPNGFWSYDFLKKETAAYRDQHGDEDWLTLTYQIFYDNLAKKLWVGTQSGLASFDALPSPFTIFSKSSKSNTRIKHAFSLLPVSSNEVYCGDENGLFHIYIATKEITKIDNGSSNLLLFKDKVGHIFVSNKSGFYLLTEKSLTRIHKKIPSLKQLETDQFSCALQFNDSILLFGSVIQKGLYVWNNRTGELKIFHNDSVKHTLANLSIINNLYKSNNEKIFILTEKAIIQFDPLTGDNRTYIIKKEDNAESFVNFMDMCETPDNYWIATYGDGLLKLDKNFNLIKRISTSNGLKNDCVYKVFPFKNTSILATTNYGLSVIDSDNYNTQTYFQFDGLHSSLFEQLCGYQYAEKIYAGGVNGFSIIDPAILFSNPNPPRLYINKVTIQTKNNTIDTSNIDLKELNIPNDVIQVTIFMSGLNYKNPTRTSYEYKLNNKQGSWVNLGSQNFINLPHLPPGNYTFLFRSANEAGVWNKEPIIINLKYLPKWYQTLFFRLMLIFFIIAFSYALYRYRLLQFRKQQEIRTEIASDLHDDIGSILNSVKIFTHLAKKEPGKDNYLNLIEDSLTQATLGLRDMIWVLDDSRDTVYEVMERIKNYSLPVCQAKKISLQSHIETESSSLSLNKTEKRNLLLISKEAINNSIKYSNCQTITITIKQTRSKVFLCIQDDGNGFNLTLLTKGNGLKNIQRRAEQINSIADFITTPGQGTRIIIKKKMK